MKLPKEVMNGMSCELIRNTDTNIKGKFVPVITMNEEAKKFFADNPNVKISFDGEDKEE